MARMAPTRSTIGTVVCITLALGSWLVLRRDQRRGRPLTAHKRRGIAQVGVALLLRVEGVQTAIDYMTRRPNLGALLSAVAMPTCAAHIMGVYDDLMDASPRRRRWHRIYPLVISLPLAVCWWRGVPGDRRLHWQFSGLAAERGNRWRAAFELLSILALHVPCVEGILAAKRIVVHLYATGTERALCLRSLLFGVSWCANSLFTASLLIQPIARLAGRRDRFAIPLVAQQSLVLISFVSQILAATAPRWSLGTATGPSRSRLERWIERLLRGLFVISCYDDVRRLAFALRDAVPTRTTRVQFDQTAWWRVQRLSELELLLQMFKTIVNDARLMLADYVDDDYLGDDQQPPASAPELTAAALANALCNFARGCRPSACAVEDNPLRDAVSFNDERFLAAVWQANRRCRRPASPWDGVIVPMLWGHC